jgi:OOP family OmpA-OmpF porin
MNTILFLQKNNIHFLPSCKAKHIVNRVLLLMMGCTVLVQAQSQADKRLVQADQYFTAGDYYTAAHLYGQFLKPAVNKKTTSDFPLNSNRTAEGRTGKYGDKNDILFKQAESYRLANYLTDAAALYKECFEKDSAKYAAALYWYAVCQRSMGNYAVAEETVNRFLNEYAAGNPYQQAAEKERQTLQFIKGQVTKPDSALYHVQKINPSFGTGKGVFAPVASLVNQFTITSTERDSVAVGMNPYRNRLFHSVLTDSGLLNMEPVTIASIDSSLNQGAASISADGNYLYFTQWKKEKGQAISSIYYSGKTAEGWSEPRLLSSVNEQGSNSKQPFCSADGKYLFFASDRADGFGNFDIWYAQLQPDGTTGQPENAGAVINTAGNEQAPFYHTGTGTLVFASDGIPGMGGYDLFTSKGGAHEWKAAENMGYPVNSPRDDVYFFTSGKKALLDQAFFSSDRGSECCLGTYAVTKTPKKIMITGMIRDCSNNEPVADAAVTMKDAAGKTMQATTTADGKYSFELNSDNDQHELFVTKEKYTEKNAGITVEGCNEINWQTDTLYNSALCLEKKLEIKVENIVVVHFDFDQSQINDRGIAQLDSIYAILMEDSLATIQISGYTDGLGSVEYNKILSDKRAKACGDYLVQRGIDTGRVSFESFGACCPVEMELLDGRDNPDGRSKNRRALINIDKSRSGN